MTTRESGGAFVSSNEIAVKEAVASSVIEGYEIDPETIDLCMLLAEGKITQAEYIMRVLQMSEGVKT